MSSRPGCTPPRWLTLVLLAALPCLAQEGQTRHVHDPAIIAETPVSYYVFSTGHGIPIRHSADLLHWQDAGRVFSEDVPAWAKQEIPKVNFPWAPDISFFKGRYWLYYSISTFGSQRSCTGLATNTTLDASKKEYRWVDRGKVLESHPGQDDFNAIDPAAFTDEKGRRWLVWGSFWGGIKMTRLDPETGMRLASEPTVHSLACRPEAKAIEASYIIFEKGYYYLFVSFDRCCAGVNSNYKTMVGRAKEPTGPYVSFTDEPMTQGGATLVLAGYDDCRGPGHNSILQQAGKTYLVHHMYDAAANGIPTLQIRPLIWSANGWPLATEPLDHYDAEADKAKITETQLLGTWRHSVDFGKGADLKLLADGHINEPRGKSAWRLSGNRLRLTWPAAGAPGGAWADDCYVAPDGKLYVGRNQNGQLIRGVKVEKKE